MLSSNTSAVASGDANYIEDVFSTYLYTGTGAAQTITNNIDLSGEGGMVWIKDRSGSGFNVLFDTVRGATNYLSSNTTTGNTTSATTLTAFNTNGFSVSTNASVNTSGNLYASWAFRKQPKFFDVVTYTGTGSATTIAHNLGSVPGCIMVKRTDSAVSWFVYHRSLGATSYLVLNSTNTTGTSSTVWNDTSPTSTQFTVGSTSGTNASGGTYVAYVFAHDAGGFGLTGSDNVISCGSFTSTGGSRQSVNLGYEAQYILVKRTDSTGNWLVMDSMRGTSSWVGTLTPLLYPNASSAESSTAIYASSTATGFDYTSFAAGTYIYMAIRRGPMKVPTDATKVFKPYNTTVDSSNWYQSGFVNDFILEKAKSGTDGWYTASRLTDTTYFKTETTASEASSSAIKWQSNTSAIQFATGYGVYQFQRAPSFMDIVCYTGTGANRTVTHNLGAVPELMIVKDRTNVNAWQVYSAALANTEYLVLNTTAAKATGATRWNSTTPTSSVFSLGTDATVNNGDAYMAYLFATCPGVSKVGSYTGTGTTKQVDCGFAAGARFVLIKRTDSTGDWYVWDTTRGIVSGNDPYLLLNSTAAEVTSTDYIDTYAAGFELSSTAPAAINASGGTYIFLAIA